ncbi:RNA polymerase sigma factor [Corallincola spongiicola]|uniref:RNA polymerase sigma factor n=1 Tax=Corallincola spongiicola TaxID=2520508 RepID=A0ABY1WR22_9GAMM|nr:RNA polymerase sigma factor [Corallincola spongiicola]TAA47170.1 RNA polymerase sigma factor [Corallincola spongiicola]
MREPLVQQAQHGDKAAFKALYDDNVGRVYALALRMLGNRSQAEDVTQEVFISAWKQLAHFRGESKFSTWLYSIATARISDHCRKHKNWHLVGELHEGELNRGNDPQNHLTLALEQAIQRLPAQARSVFVLYAIEGFGHRQVAEMLEIAEGSSKAQFHRARQLLKEWLKDE